MKTTTWLMGAGLCALALQGCANGIDYDSPEYKDANRLNAYTTAWVNKFGPIAPNHDWCMIDAIAASVGTDGNDEIVTTKIYTTDPADGGRLKATVNGNGSVLLDVAEGTAALYAVMCDAEGAVVAKGQCEIADGTTAITPTSLTPKRMSRHVDNDPYRYSALIFDAIIVCEDMGTIGDFDFNDIVLGLRTVKEGGTTTLTITPMAAGGTLTADVWFGGESKGEIHGLMSDNGVCASGPFYNTSAFNGQGTDIVVDNLASDWTIAANWGNIKLKVQDATGDAIEIKAAQPGKAPQMICLPGDFYWPKETISIKDAYTGFADWATSSYTGDSWLDRRTDTKVVPWSLTTRERLNYFIATTTDGSQYTYGGKTCESGAPCEFEPRTSFLQAFYSKQNMKTLDLNGSHFCTSGVTDMQSMFYGCTNLISIDLGNFDTSSVTTMSHMFNGCTGLTSLDLHSFNTSNVTNMAAMFWNCYDLTNLDVSSFDTSNVTDMVDMFLNCSSLTSLDLSNFDTSKVTDMRLMFSGCTNLTSLNLSNFDVSSIRLVTFCSQMFKGCSNDLEITCTAAIRDWLIPRASTINLPTPLKNASSAQWHIIDNM